MVREKVVHYTQVEKERVENANGTWIRWLITERDGAPNFAMRLFEVEPGGHIPAHKHPWEHEIFVLEGEGRIRIGDNNYVVKPGYVVFIPPDIVHEYWNTGKTFLKFICVIPLKSRK